MGLRDWLNLCCCLLCCDKCLFAHMVANRACILCNICTSAKPTQTPTRTSLYFFYLVRTRPASPPAGILKSSALRGTGSTVQSDERTAIAHEIMALGVPGLLRLIYPTVYHVSDVSGAWGTQAPGQAVVMPSTVPASLVYLDPQVCGGLLLVPSRVG